MARKKSGDPVGPPPTPGWLATYGDMVTNMLCFFVLMLSFSNTDAAKFREMASALQGVLTGAGSILPDQGGILPSGVQPPSGEGRGSRGSEDASLPSSVVSQLTYENVVPPSISAESYEELMRETIEVLHEALEESGAEQGIDLKPSERGVIVRFAESLLFDAGSATLRPEAIVAISALLEPLQAIDNSLLIEGHTCDLPIHTAEFRNNWYLSSGRALSVLEYLESKGIAPGRMRAIGHGEYQNLVPNSSEENRQRNRRVDIIILNRQSD